VDARLGIGAGWFEREHPAFGPLPLDRPTLEALTGLVRKRLA